MSDIQVQDPYVARPKFYKYESEDRQLLVDLLHEYSDKLISVARELEIKIQQAGSNAKLNKLIELIFKVSLYATGFPLILMCCTMIGVVIFSRYQLLLSGKIDLSDLGILFFLLITATITTFSLMQLSKSNTRRTLPKKIARSVYLLNRDARLIADKLEKVMRVTIEIQDKIEINLARKLELDLRIADAQSALEYYYSIVEAK